MPKAFFLVAQYFDGKHSAAELSELLLGDGIKIDPESIEVIAEQLGEAMLLDDGRTRSRLVELERDLLARPRPARLTGSCYPKDAARCRKWIDGHTGKDETLVGSADIQSLADLSNSFEVVQEMRLVPFGRVTVLRLVLLTALPFAPLMLTMIPLEQLIDRVLGVFF